jgi:hypothetical protein
MLKPIRIRKWRIPNALAIAAALLLLASSLAHVEGPTPAGEAGMSLATLQPASVEPAQSAHTPLAQAPVKKTPKFRVNLFLFRH